jgi:hypothetical protein
MFPPMFRCHQSVLSQGRHNLFYDWRRNRAAARPGGCFFAWPWTVPVKFRFCKPAISSAWRFGLGLEVAMFQRLNTQKQFIKGTPQHFYEVPDMLLRDPPSSGLNIRYYLTGHV